MTSSLATMVAYRVTCLTHSFEGGSETTGYVCLFIVHKNADSKCSINGLKWIKSSAEVTRGVSASTHDNVESRATRTALQ